MLGDTSMVSKQIGSSDDVFDKVRLQGTEGADKKLSKLLKNCVKNTPWSRRAFFGCTCRRYCCESAKGVDPHLRIEWFLEMSLLELLSVRSLKMMASQQMSQVSLHQYDLMR